MQISKGIHLRDNLIFRNIFECFSKTKKFHINRNNSSIVLHLIQQFHYKIQNFHLYSQFALFSITV